MIQRKLYYDLIHDSTQNLLCVPRKGATWSKSPKDHPSIIKSSWFDSWSYCLYFPLQILRGRWGEIRWISIQTWQTFCHRNNNHPWIVQFLCEWSLLGVFQSSREHWSARSHQVFGNQWRWIEYNQLRISQWLYNEPVEVFATDRVENRVDHSVMLAIANYCRIMKPLKLSLAQSYQWCWSVAIETIHRTAINIHSKEKTATKKHFRQIYKIFLFIAKFWHNCNSSTNEYKMHESIYTSLHPNTSRFSSVCDFQRCPFPPWYPFRMFSVSVWMWWRWQ